MDGVYLSIYLTKKDGTTIYLAIYDYDETQYWIVSGNLSIYVPKVEGITIAMSLLNSKIYINGTVYDSISKSGGVLTNRVIISHAYKDGIGGSLETDVEKCEYSRTSNMDVNLIPPVNILYCSLSGGCAFADANGNMSTTNQSKYGFPTNNEWDKYIMNYIQIAEPVRQQLGQRALAGARRPVHRDGSLACSDSECLRVKSFPHSSRDEVPLRAAGKHGGFHPDVLSCSHGSSPECTSAGCPEREFRSHTAWEPASSRAYGRPLPETSTANRS
jgi:hypothetical protein